MSPYRRGILMLSRKWTFKSTTHLSRPLAEKNINYGLRVGVRNSSQFLSKLYIFFWNRKNKLFSLINLSPKHRFSRSISYSTLTVENPNKKSFEIIFFLEVGSWGVGPKSGNFPDCQWVSLVNL